MFFLCHYVRTSWCKWVSVFRFFRLGWFVDRIYWNISPQYIYVPCSKLFGRDISCVHAVPHSSHTRLNYDKTGIRSHFDSLCNLFRCIIALFLCWELECLYIYATTIRITQQLKVYNAVIILDYNCQKFFSCCQYAVAYHLYVQARKTS